MELEDENLVSLAQDELKDLIGLEGDLQWSEVQRYHGMPQFQVGHLSRVETIEKAMVNHEGLELAGNAFHGMGIPDCVRSGEKSAAAVHAYLGC